MKGALRHQPTKFPTCEKKNSVPIKQQKQQVLLWLKAGAELIPCLQLSLAVSCTRCWLWSHQGYREDKLPLQFKRVTEAVYGWDRGSLHGGLKRPLSEVVEGKLWFVLDTPMMVVELILQAVKLEGQCHLSTLTSDKKLQNLKFALLGFGLTLVYCFPTMTLFLPFGMNSNVYLVSLYVGRMYLLF